MILFLALLLTFVSGSLIAGVALHDPDTCWQLVLGKLIFDSGTIIRTDPFSYTFSPSTAGHNFVMYQWLSNLIFYTTYKAGGLFGLLCLTAEILSLSFIILPLLHAREKSVPASSTYLVIILGSMAACFHFLARPEIWSYLLLSIYLVLALRMSDLTTKKTAVDWKIVLGIFVIMIAWCNLHSGFVLGIILLAILAICAIVDRRLNSTILVSLIAAIAASLCNPYGFELWTYLPQLFFPAFNKYIVELRPLGLGDFNTFTFFPYILISLVSLIHITKTIGQQGIKATGSFPLVATVLVICAGAACRRFIPFSVIVQTALIMQFLIPDNSNKKSTINSFLLGAILMVVVATGAYWTTTRDTIKLEIPQSSIVFQPPMKAIEYLKTSLPAGNMLNDPQFGDVMILHMNPPPKLFIDTRFDMYGSQLVSDYYKLAKCHDDFANKLNSYNISWVFMRPEEKLIAHLKQNNAWTTVYEDKQSVILVRNK